MMGVASLAILALVCLLLLFPLRSNSLEDSSKIAQLSAEVAGERLAKKINGAVDVLRAYSDVITQIAGSKVILKEEKRELLLTQLSVLGKTNETLTNLWCILEPNVLDGMDSNYTNRMGSNADGIFTPWFSGGTLASAVHMIATDLYSIPKSTGKEFISDPFEDEFRGKKMKVFSFSVPIMLDGNFIGVIATDFDVSELNNLIAGLNHNTRGKLITNGGKVAVYHDMERIGQIAEHGNLDILDKLPEGKMFEGLYPFEGEVYYKVYVPILLGKTNNPWFYAVDVPTTDVYAKSRSTVGYLIVFFIIGILLITLAGSLLITPILNRVIKITGIIRQLALGHIHHLQIGSQQHEDEIGKMNEELNHLVDGLKNTANFAHNIGEGKFDAEYHLLSDDDMLGNSLIEMRGSLQNAAKEQSVRAKEEEHRNWGTEGLAKFAEILRQDNNNLESLSYNVISNMVKYLDANQGGIFILNHSEDETNNILEMTACYAYDRKKFGVKQIHPGEGLVGTCYLEGQTIYLTDVPNDYITITSGLGEANPRAVCICPLKVNDIIYGVVELASFRTFEPYQLEFIEKLCESIAATISSVNVNIRTNRLLEKSKLQSEEMANHEEELRQTMEEMQATQEEMRRRESDLNEALKKVGISEKMMMEKSNWYELMLDTITEPVSATDMDKNVTFINKAGLDVLGKTRKEVVGKFCGDVWGVDICKDDRCGIECLKRGIEKSYFHVGDQKFSTTPSYLKDLFGNNIGHIEVVGNLTEEEKRFNEMQTLQKQFEEKSNWYEFMLDSIVEPLSVTDMEKTVTFINKAGLDVLGKTREEVIGKYCGHVWGVDICKDHRCGIECMKRGEGKSIFQVGDQKFTTLARYVKDLNGNNIGHLEVVDDITEIYNQEIAKKDKEYEMQQFHNAVFDSCNIVMFSDEGMITDVNEKLLNIFPGFNKSKFIGRRISEFVSKECYQEAWEHLTNGKIFEETQPIDTGSGILNFHHKYIPICDKNGKMLWILLILYRVSNKDKK